MHHTWIPTDACTLPTAEQPVRLKEFDDLLAETIDDVQRLGADRLRLTLRGGTGLPERVRDLAERESACCSFFTFTLTPVTTDSRAGAHLRLDIAVPATRRDVLDALADRTEVMGSGGRP